MNRYVSMVKITCFKVFCASLLILGIGSVAQAALYDRGGGMIYDDVLDITWLRDANYAQTSGYVSDGKMTWEQAVAWAEELNYGGYDDWRLPSALNQDGSGPCLDIFGDPLNRDGDCVGSEIGHMYYVNLGLKRGESMLSSTDPNLDYFINLELHPMFWFNTKGTVCESPGTPPGPACAWNFWIDTGAQITLYTRYKGLAWAVRDGDVASAPPLPVVSINSVDCSNGIVTVGGSGFGSYINTAGSGTTVVDIDDSEQCGVQSWTDTNITADCGSAVDGSIRVSNGFGSSATVGVEGCKSSSRPNWWDIWNWWSSWSWSRR